jgi:hypothetical protein
VQTSRTARDHRPPAVRWHGAQINRKNGGYAATRLCMALAAQVQSLEAGAALGLLAAKPTGGRFCPGRSVPHATARVHTLGTGWGWSGLRGGMRACAFACAMRLVAGMHSTRLWPAPTSRHWAQAAQSSAICQALQHAKTRWRHLRTSHRVSGLVQLRY